MRTRRKYPVVCHPGRNHCSRGLCRACYQYWQRRGGGDRWRLLDAIVKDHPERKAVAAAAWESQDKRRRRRDAKSYARGREKALRDRYGIGIAEYEKLMSMQGGGCAVCKRAPANGPLYVDHRHDDGAVRGLLCPGCNTLVGFLEKRGALLPIAVEYLKRHQEAPRPQ